MKIWNKPKNILVILAHPDDPEFFCGGTIYKWTEAGHTVHYCLLTHGDKGINDNFQNTPNITEIREIEQSCAAKVLGVKKISYCDFMDGEIVPTLSARKKVTGFIRKIKPHIVVTCDPTNYYVHDNYINHPDHRATGQIVLDAIFPGVQNELFFPELLEEGLKPHYVEEVWISLPKEPNVELDVTKEWKQKLKALECHVSQIGNPDSFRERMNNKFVGIDKENQLIYKEHFRRIIFSK